MCALQAFAFVTDLYMGTSNGNATLRATIAGNLDTAANGVSYNYDILDDLTLGLGAQNVRPYYAITYAPWPFQPLTTSANVTTGLTSCLGFENAGYPEHYSWYIFHPACILTLHLQMLIAPICQAQ